MDVQYRWECVDCDASEDNTKSSTDHQIATGHAIVSVRR